MPRYEFSEGSSNKFWDITLSGKSFTTTYGKIGANGQTTIKSFKSDADAKKEHDKVVAEKTKKGYVLVGGKAKPNGKAKPAKAEAAAPTTGKRDARNKDLEAAIVANPSDREAYAVFADWLQEQGDPRGELMSLQLGYKDKQAKQLIEKHVDYFLGPLAEHQTVYDEGLNNSVSHLRSKAQEAEWQKTHQQAFLWRNGFIYRVRLSHDSYSHESFEGQCAEILEQVFSHPSGRYVVELAFHSNGDPNEDDLQDIIETIGKKAPPTIRKITFGDNVDQISWHHTGNLSKMWKAVPNLKTLEIESGDFDVGKMTAPALERAIFITGGMSKSCGKNIANAVMPKIRHLEVYYGDDNYGGDCTVKEAKPLLDRTDLKDLQYLGLKNSQFANELAKVIAGGAKVVKGLKTLDLSLGTMTDEGANALAAAKDSLKHLEVLDLTRNFLTKDGIKAVKGICPKVLTGEQEQADDDGDGEVHYYVSIAE
ncbi:MAG: WGR domain-containing protein [Myxococcota bacterium]|nr:WGR domain-containing protein [Myxococcota bacterium]